MHDMLQKKTRSVINNAPNGAKLELVADFANRLATGVTVSETGRVFVCFPYWIPDMYAGAVAQVMEDGSLRPYPDEAWNAWRLGGEQSPADHFVCVQSVVSDRAGSLYALDPAAPKLGEVVEDGPKLVKINLETDAVETVYYLNPRIAPKNSYLNDVRIDVKRQVAYITDSGRGAIIVLDLTTGEAARLLDGHRSTQADIASAPMIGGKPLRTPGGEVPQIHSDGIALDNGGEHLYFHALTGYHTYRVPTRALRQAAFEEGDAARAVEDLGSDVITDGMHLDADGNLYYTALEYDGILKRTPRGDVQPVIIDPELIWPDTLAIGPDGHLYITAAQLNRMPRFSGGTANFEGAFELFRIDLDIQPPNQ
jgi:sugar lactone lactonase YvrE